MVKKITTTAKTKDTQRKRRKARTIRTPCYWTAHVYCVWSFQVHIFVLSVYSSIVIGHPISEEEGCGRNK